MFSEKDIQQIEERGSSLEKIQEQVENFKKGFPNLTLSQPATIDNGILKLTEKEIESHIQTYDSKSSELSIIKFIPASGAASRMFKDLYAFVSEYRDDDKGYEEFVNGNSFPSVYQFFKRITDFAFFKTLKKTYDTNDRSLEEDLLKRKYKPILKALLDEDGMNYGNLPKGLLEFHAYKDTTRTSVEEHLVEGALYSTSKDNHVRIHFTVSPEHKDIFEKKIGQVIKRYESEFNAKFSIEYSIQKPSTDTIAVDMKNQPFREDNGELLFRPGGHGALLENLNEIEADIIFIKNIDNVVPDHLKGETVKFKKAVAGKLIEIQEKIFDYLKKLESVNITDEELEEILKFIENELFIKKIPEFHMKDEQVTFIRSKLNRPIRVCGMVKNEGEPGGGPFFAENSDGTVSLQIAETSQIDLSEPEQKQIFNQSTHFNPVDLVLGVKNFRNKKFHLTKYIDQSTGFISKKSKGGRELKAQELPGLWNGSMSDWNTIFVEVPIITFNPVKTVNDLLRETHQAPD